MKKGIIFLLFLLYSINSNAQIANLGNTGSQSGWYKIGTLTLPQQGADAEITIIAAGGYNANYSQNGECKIHFRTSNGSSSDNGFFGSGTFYNTGRTTVVSELTIVQINQYTWDFYCIMPGYTGENAIVSLKSTGGSWQGGLSLFSPPTNLISLRLKEELTIKSDVYQLGNVGIGTTTPKEKLSVNGKIRAHEVKVETANWPDYVFEEGYKVGTLEELESYIKVNKHLPEVPSAKEVETNGIELGEMNKILMKKIEELTLHLIELKKDNIKMQQDIHQLKNKTKN